MSHLFFDNVGDAIESADSVYTTTLGALNNSGASGNVFLMREGNNLTVAIAAQGLTPGEAHIQHIHGTFDGQGNPTDATSPDISDDADGDGYVELGEGVPSYGPIVLPLENQDGSAPTADGNGDLYFMRTFDLTDGSVFADGFNADDLGDLSLREIVVHGLDVPDGAGAGTGGEVDGGANGYTPVLPVLSGEIDSTTSGWAMDLLGASRTDFGERMIGSNGEDNLFGASANDSLLGRNGDDRVVGNGGDDYLVGNNGDDRIAGNLGDDTVFAGNGDDGVFGGGGDDELHGNRGDDKVRGGGGNDEIFGDAGNDTLMGNKGDDHIMGGSGEDLFVYRLGDGNDVIGDFKIGQDTLNLASIDEDTVDIAINNAGTVITFEESGHSILLDGVKDLLPEDAIIF